MRARLLVLLLLLPIVSATFTAELTPDNRVIKLNETAKFLLTITHDSATSQDFEIYSPDVIWDVTTEPAADRILTVYPTEKRQTTLILRPLYVNPGTYVVPIHVRLSGKNQLVKTFAIIGAVVPTTPVGTYIPTVTITPKLDPSIDPRGELTVPVLLENKNRRDLGSVTVKLRSGLINADYTTTLGPLEKKEVRITTRIDALTPPQDDTLKATVFIGADNTTYQYDSAIIPYRVDEYGEIAPDAAFQDSFLKHVQTITFTNTGNTPRTLTYTVQRAYWGLFTKATPRPDIVVRDGTKVYAWEIRLAPREQTELTIVTNYRSIFYLAILIALCVLAYYLLRSPIILRKSATIVTTHEGGISELKVLIHVINRSKHELTDVAILDKVPRIASVVKDEEIGTVRPVKILHDDKRGTMIKWRFDAIEPSEERLIAYKMRSSLTILGGLQLPVAVAKFQSHGRERSTRSNVSQIGFGGND